MRGIRRCGAPLFQPWQLVCSRGVCGHFQLLAQGAAGGQDHHRGSPLRQAALGRARRSSRGAVCSPRHVWRSFGKGEQRQDFGTIEGFALLCESLFFRSSHAPLCLAQGRDTVVYRRTSADSAASWPPRFWKLTLELGSGAQLALIDPRRFARVKLGPPAPPPHLGWDPLLSWPSFLAFSDKLGATRRSAKAVLLDQTVCAGVGNWIADEALYQARIHPEQVASDLDQHDVQRLHRLIPEICNAAIAVDANAAKLPEHWMFHARWGQGVSRMPAWSPSTTCAGMSLSCCVSPQSQVVQGFQGQADGGRVQDCLCDRGGPHLGVCARAAGAEEARRGHGRRCEDRGRRARARGCEQETTARRGGLTGQLRHVDGLFVSSSCPPALLRLNFTTTQSPAVLGGDTTERRGTLRERESTLALQAGNRRFISSAASRMPWRSWKTVS